MIHNKIEVKTKKLSAAGNAHLEPSRHIALVSSCQDYRIKLLFLSIHKFGSIDCYLLHIFHHLQFTKTISQSSNLVKSKTSSLLISLFVLAIELRVYLYFAGFY